ncbi:MAG: hypothetical protein BWZ10_02840 [candidate division BRC1 bacterium ADurb.BinA364]|nr:MAG: hypothetical protein BWZ10_02840 [candidate division BRC1 bacterium ADurb.BinA364]
MVNKEAESVVGPMLRRIAERHGLVYAPADGDQPALLIQLVSWARTLGLHVLCGGKSRDMEYILREREGCVSDRFGKAAISAEDAWAFEPVRGDDAEEKMLARRIALASLRQAQDYDLCETAIMANATGLMPDKPALHAPVCRISEIPSMLCPRGRGGVLAREGAIDLVTCLRRPDEAGLGGGVFAVVACENAYARETLARKGLISNPARDCHLIYRPSHLLGIETPTSALCAALLGVPTGGAEVEPRVDLVAAPVRNISAGETVEIRRGGKEELKAWLEPARPIEDGAPAPLHLAEGCRLKRHAAAGEPIRVDMLEEPPGSRLWALRREQDSRFAIRRA